MSEQPSFEPTPLPASDVEPARTDRFAVASVILGVLGFFGITLVLGLVFGIVALLRIRGTREHGTGLAIAGIATSLVWAMIIPVALVLVLSNLPTPSNSAILALKVDDCYTKARPGHDAAKESCTKPHDGEVMDAFSIGSSQDPYPGDSKVFSFAQGNCESRLDAMFGNYTLPQTVAITSFAPGEQDWQAGKRLAICALEFRAGPMTAPLH